MNTLKTKENGLECQKKYSQSWIAIFTLKCIVLYDRTWIKWKMRFRSAWFQQSADFWADHCQEGRKGRKGAGPQSPQTSSRTFPLWMWPARPAAAAAHSGQRGFAATLKGCSFSEDMFTPPPTKPPVQACVFRGYFRPTDKPLRCSRESFQSRDQTPVSCVFWTGRRSLLPLHHLVDDK